PTRLSSRHRVVRDTPILCTTSFTRRIRVGFAATAERASQLKLELEGSPVTTFRSFGRIDVVPTRSQLQSGGSTAAHVAPGKFVPQRRSYFSGSSGGRA